MSEQDHGSPVEALGILAQQEVQLTETLTHREYYTSHGLLSLFLYLPHREDTDAAVGGVVMGGGAMGGLLGGAGLYHELGLAFAAAGLASVSVGWRQPNDLGSCTHDMIASMQLLASEGPRRFVTIGHSFGGAIAIRCAAAVHASVVPGVVTLATQSGGCEPVETLGDRELLFFHGDADRILAPMSSEMVRMLAGTGELVILPGENHLLAGAKEQIKDRLLTWIPNVLASDQANQE